MGYILKIGDSLPTIGNNILANNNTVISSALAYNPPGAFNSLESHWMLQITDIMLILTPQYQ